MDAAERFTALYDDCHPKVFAYAVTVAGRGLAEAEADISAGFFCQRVGMVVRPGKLGDRGIGGGRRPYVCRLGSVSGGGAGSILRAQACHGQSEQPVGLGGGVGVVLRGQDDADDQGDQIGDGDARRYRAVLYGTA